MLIVSLGLVTVAGVLATLIGGATAGHRPRRGGQLRCRTSAGWAFESIVQREAPSANHGRAFATFETKFQFGWVVAGVIPVVVEHAGRRSAT